MSQRVVSLCASVLLAVMASSAGAVSAMDDPSMATTARLVTITTDQIVPIYAKVRFTTLLTLPEGEEIVDVTCGDREFWLVNVHPNARVVSVKPAKVDSQSNLNIVTTSGQVYAFVLHEVSKRPDQAPDLSIHLQRDPLDLLSTAARAPRYVPAAQADDLRRDLERANAELQAAKAAARQQIETAVAQDRATYPASLRFVYRYKPANRSFRIRAMFHDGRFTYLQGDGELPAIYEIRDDAPALVQFEVKGQTYIVHKVLDRGYLAIGRERLPFTREGR